MVRSSKFSLFEFRRQPIPSENEIMAGWVGDPAQPVVSVLCNTYNHKTYIEDAIRGFLLQKTSFPFEVIVHDDASIDGTSEIIRCYAREYPKIIKPVIQNENQYNQGKKPTILSLRHSIGKYVALCEGDDFWISRDKLSLEVAAASNSACGLVFTSAITLVDNIVSGRVGPYGKTSGVVSLDEIIIGSGSYCPTPSLLVTQEIMKELASQEWFLAAPVGDLYIQAYAAIKSGAYFINSDTCVYRIRASGSWTACEKNLTQEELFLARQLSAISGLSRRAVGISAELINQMKGNAYYFSAIRFLKLREFSEFSRFMVKANSLLIKRSKGFKFFFILRRFPRVAFFFENKIVSK